MLGFPSVSVHARELERLLEDVGRGDFNASRANLAFDALEQAFTEDLARPPQWVGPDPGSGGNRRVMVVEDDEDQREVVCINLRAAGYLPVPVHAGDMALEVARAQKPDLILLDANLPGMDGYTVCRLLKTDPVLASTPVLFMTVRSGLDDRLVGLALGADDYLVKPVDSPELMVRIQILLARHAQQGEAAQPAPREAPSRHA
jgi:CheY-like chemotaxis protein